MIPLDLMRATNLYGALDDDCRSRLTAVVENQTDATWDAAFSLILNARTWKTLWQAVIAVDPEFPRTGPSSRLGGARGTWEKVPTREVLLAALRHAVTEAAGTWDAVAARDEAIERVERNAGINWLLEAERIVILLPPGEEFTTDTVWTRLAAREDLAPTHEPRALGAVMMRLARAGEISKTGRYIPSRRKECHARPIPVWVRLRGLPGENIDGSGPSE